MRQFFFWNVTMNIKLVEIQIPPINSPPVFTKFIHNMYKGVTYTCDFKAGKCNPNNNNNNSNNINNSNNKSAKC